MTLKNMLFQNVCSDISINNILQIKIVLILCNRGGEGRGWGGGTRLPILSTFVGLVLLPVNYSEDSEYIHLL